MSKDVPEIEDMVVLGPGRVLAEARAELGLSIEDVADKLNFRISLVKEIEADVFDKSLSDTFNRGYLKNYAKLVNITNDEIIGLYENLNIAQENQSQMQSFSNNTTKEAHNNMLMWITYLILVVFIGLTVMWWLQDDKASNVQEEITIVPIESNFNQEEELAKKKDSVLANVEPLIDSVKNASSNSIQEEAPAIIKSETPEVTQVDEAKLSASDEVIQASPEADIQTVTLTSPTETLLSKMTFSFSGDCWVNIHDALGERIAWGIKKAGYVMNIEAQAPLKVTIGKPELVKINFDGENIDMSEFPEGHVAKLSLPFLPQS